MMTGMLAAWAASMEAGRAEGCTGECSLHLYVAMVSLAYYGRAHAFTLSRIFNKDLHKATWQKAHLNLTRQMVAAFLAPPA